MVPSKDREGGEEEACLDPSPIMAVLEQKMLPVRGCDRPIASYAANRGFWD